MGADNLSGIDLSDILLKSCHEGQNIVNLLYTLRNKSLRGDAGHI